VSALLLLAITAIVRTNGPGMCITIVAVVFAVVVGGVVGHGAAYWIGFGLGAVVLDILSRRYLLRCPLNDVRRGTMVMGFPMWIPGMFALALGGTLALMSLAQ
jgi:hypothetical protein